MSDAGNEHELRDIAIGIDARGVRRETDSMGEIEVPADRYWGAQTQRSLVHFSIGDDSMPKQVYHAYGYVKKAAALVNAAAGRLEPWRSDAICKAADEAIAQWMDVVKTGRTHLQDATPLTVGHARRW